jgi:UDP-N-acetylmuramoyl-tripeptide--D-alanyl-D-alanine ligase
VEHPFDDADKGSADGKARPLFRVLDTARALGDLARSWRQKHGVQVIGVTGSVGKTTTKEVIAHLLGKHFNVLRSEANRNTDLSLPLALMELDPSHQIAVLEMGMLAVGEIQYLAGLAQPKVGVVTNVGPIHLERLGTIERIAQAKSELVQALPANGLAVLNGDDPRVRGMARATDAPACFFGTSPQSDVWASEVRSLGLDGTAATFHCRGEQAKAHLRLLGAHSVYAGAAALAVAVHFGVPFQQATHDLETIPPGPRLQLVAGMNGSRLIDDAYNASPPSVEAALSFLASLEGRKIAVLGDMLELGSYEAEGHREAGRKAAGVADLLLTVGELAQVIAAEARAQGMPAERVASYSTAAEAVARLKSELTAGDCVLIKGSRSMHLEEVVGGLRVSPQPA